MFCGDFVSARLKIVCDPTALAAGSGSDAWIKLKRKEAHCGRLENIYSILGAVMEFRWFA